MAYFKNYDHWTPSTPFATWLCCFFHKLIELLPYPLDLDWPCDFLWPTECGKVTVPVLWSGYKGFACSCSVSWKPATATWTNPGQPTGGWDNTKRRCQTSQQRLSEASLYSADLPKCGTGKIHRAPLQPTTDACVGSVETKENIQTT